MNGSGSPLLVCLASMSWDFMWQRHQELMSRFARAGYRVVFVEPIGIRMPGWQDRQRIVNRLKHRRAAGARGVREKMPNVWIVDPLVIPFQNVGVVHRRNADMLVRALQNAIEQVGGGTPIIWTYVPTPLALEVIARLPHRLLVYDCVDALTLNPKGVFKSYAACEQELARKADLVITTSPRLYARERPWNPHTYLITHGVEYDEFANPPPDTPAGLEPLPAPRLIFFGGIDERIDLELLDRLAAHHPEWSILLLGLVRTDVATLRRRPNVHFVGLVPHAALPGYLHHADVLLLPYRRIAFTEYIYPAKLFECLAVGKPIVATPVPALLAFDRVLTIAHSHDEFERAVDEAVREGSDPLKVAERQAVARANAWSARFEEIVQRMADARRGGA